MWMFLSVSGHSSELSIANHSSWSTVSQLKCVYNTIYYEADLRITNHRRQKYAPFIQNSNQIASRLTTTTSFPRVFFQLLQFSRQRPSFLAHRAASMTKTDLIFPAFSSRFVDFAVQFAASFHSTRSDAGVMFDSGTIFLHQSQFFATLHFV